MNDFKELREPKWGLIDGWYIATVNDSPQEWLTIRGDITRDVSTVLYYKSELEAHKAARQYYHSFGIGYSHIDRISELIKLMEVLGETVETNDFESQVMVFE